MYRGSGRIAALAISGVLGLAACQPIPPVKAQPQTTRPHLWWVLQWYPRPPTPKTSTPTTAAAPAVTTPPPTGSTTTTGPPRPPAPTTTTTAAVTTTTTASTPPPLAGGWTLVGGDEFDGTTVDRAAWKPYHNTYGDGNKELACLTPANVKESGGSLKIVARKQQVTCPSGSVRQYTSGFLGSREVGRYFPRYGRFEIRAKLPHAQGLWPAFWLRHRNGSSTAEVDVLEYFHSQYPGRGMATLHLDGRKNLSKKTVAFESSRSAPTWHTWAVEISPDPGGVRFEFLMDGIRFHSYVDSQHRWTSADPNATWDMAVNLAVGGSWTGGPDDTLGYLRDIGRCSIGGQAPSGCVTTGINRVDWTNPTTSTYEVDYVRVYAR